MEWDNSQFLLIWIVFSILWILAQRISERHQRSFRIFIVLFAVGWLWMRFNLFPFEMIAGILLSLVTSFVFWLFIGRYNPVGNPDDEGIKVYGMDD
ncbi:MAG: hypothetical protein AAFV98_06770 [Chloroflexota bacterium]